MPGPVCEADGCKPAPAPAPGFESPQTPRFSGPGNGKPKPGCPKGKHKVKRHGKTRCVAKKQQKSKGKGKNRAASTTGRAGK